MYMYTPLCRGGCARITKRHKSSTPEGSRCCLIPVLSGLQECNYVTLQYKQAMTRAQPPLTIMYDYKGQVQIGHVVMGFVACHMHVS